MAARAPWSAMPSTVVISAAGEPFAAQLMASMVQLSVGTPSTSTVQAPQEESSHPRLEPVSCNSWRNTSSSNSLGSMASSCLRPFTRSSISSFFMGKTASRAGLKKTEQTFVKTYILQDTTSRRDYPHRQCMYCQDCHDRRD